MCNFYDYMKKQVRSSNPVVEAALRSQRHDSNAELAGKYEWIENEPDTADESSPIGGSWKAYWMHNGVIGGEKVNEWPAVCSVANCKRRAEHGAHVRDAEGVVSIVPMCAKDNNPHNKKDMRLKKGLFGEMGHGLWGYEVGVASQGGMMRSRFRSAA